MGDKPAAFLGGATCDGGGDGERAQRNAETWSGPREKRMTIPPQQTFGRYTVVRHLGTGAMGEVYLATDASLKREVALKLLHREHFERDDLRARFRREARAVAQVSHPNVVQIFDIDEYQGRPFFVMEYLQGDDTQALLDEQGQIAPRTAAAIGLGAARGLAEAAAADVVHRDIKPANLFLTDRQVVKVTDFGLAKALRRTIHTSASLRLTMQGTTLGTPDYMSPEQARGDPVDARADVYGLGCTLYHLVSGKPPYREHGEKVNYMEVIGRHVTADIPTLHDHAGVPREMAALVALMMAKRRSDRPSYDDVISTLRAVSRGKVTAAPVLPAPPAGCRPASPPWATGDAEAAAEAAELLRERLDDPPPRRRGPRLVFWLTIASLLAFVGSLALWLLG